MATIIRPTPNNRRALHLEHLRRLRNQKGEPLEFDYQPHQTIPEGDWSTCLFKAGRSSGKTWTGMAWAATQAETDRPNHDGLLVARTFREAKQILIENRKSGLLQHLGDRVVQYNKSDMWIRTRSGSLIFVRSADEPDSIRSVSVAWAVCDELAFWPYPEEAYDDALSFAMRESELPRRFCMTSPLPIPLLRRLMDRADDADDPAVVMMEGTMLDNKHNPASFIDEQMRMFDGTRTGRAEIYGEYLEDVEGALIDLATIEQNRAHRRWRMVDLHEPTVGVDPAYSVKGHGDEVGIMLGGRTEDGVAVAVEDHSGKLGDRWAADVIGLALEHSARVSIERNGGNDHLAETLRAATQTITGDTVTLRRRDITLGGQKCKAWYLNCADGRTVEVFAHWASASKASRLETMAQTMRGGQLIMPSKGLKLLEDELTSYVAGVSKKSPNRCDALDYMRLGITKKTLGSGVAGRMTARAS